MPHYKLTYFNLMGLGEPIRLMFAYMGQDYEDNRIERESWPALKPKTVFGKLPMLEVDGKEVCQSATICRYLAKKCGLAGSNDWEALMIDMLVDSFQDLRGEMSKLFSETDENVKAKKKEVLMKETAPFYMTKFNDVIGKNGGFLVNGKMSWGDIFITSLCQTFSLFAGQDISAKYPNVKTMMDKVLNEPKIKAYVAKRPISDL